MDLPAPKERPFESRPARYLNEGQSIELVGRSATSMLRPLGLLFQNTFIRFQTSAPNVLLLKPSSILVIPAAL